MRIHCWSLDCQFQVVKGFFVNPTGRAIVTHGVFLSTVNYSKRLVVCALCPADMKESNDTQVTSLSLDIFSGHWTHDSDPDGVTMNIGVCIEIALGPYKSKLD